MRSIRFKQSAGIVTLFVIVGCSRTGQQDPLQHTETGNQVSHVGVPVITVVAEPPSPTYFAELHQGALERPARWCAVAKGTEPLFVDAVTVADGDDSPFMLRRLNDLPTVPRASVHAVTDESVCERAAKAYDASIWSGGVTVDQHRALRPVLVVAVGSIYLVDDLGERDGFWNVVPYDQQWNELRGHYGGGA